MKNYKSILIAIICFSFTLFSCSDILQEKTEQKSDSKTYLMVRAGGVSLNSRSIDPSEEYALANFKNIYLYGTKSGGSKRTLAGGTSGFGSLTDLYNSLILLEDGAGAYTFELKGSVDSVYFYQKLENVTIEANKTNTIEFSLSPAQDSSHLDADFGENGGLSVTVKFNKTNINKVTATLFNLDENEEVESKDFTSFSSGSITYKRVASYSTTASDGRIPTGNYRLTFDFYAYDSNSKLYILVNSIPYVVHVVKGFNSIAEQEIDLNSVYSITYNKNGGSLAAGEVEIKKYSRRSNLKLPVLTKTNCTFLGWYKDSEFKNLVTEVSKTCAENLTLYARFENSAFYVDSTSGKDDDTSYDGTSSAKAFKTLSKAIDAIKTKNEPDYDWIIHLNGTFTGAQTIYDISETEPFPANSLTLVGADFSTEADMTTLDGGFTGDAKGSTLSVAAQPPVILKKLKITGGDATFTDNSAGGGIYAYRGSVEAHDVLITGNRATKGGGVYVGSKATFSIKSGSIANNIAGTGSGVCVDSKWDSTPKSYGTFIMSGLAVVESDNDVYLNRGTHITIGGALSGTRPVAKIFSTVYENDTEILVLGEGSGTTIEDEYEKFDIIQRDIEAQITKEGKLLLNVDSVGVTSQITSMTSDGSVEISGYVANGDSFIASLYSALLTLKESDSSVKVTNLDMSGVVGLTELPDNAFWTNSTSNYVTNLESITLPDSVTSIGSSAFRGAGLTTIYIPANLTSINPDAFYDCRYLSTITISEECKNFKVVDNVLYSKDGTKLVMYVDKTTENDFTIPASVTEIGKYAFLQAKITALSFESDSTLKTIGYNAFYGCSGLTQLEIPDSVTTIELYAFYSCSNLTSVKLPNGTTSLSYCSFGTCSKLESVIIPKTLTEIESGAFTNCNALKTVYYSGSEADKAKMTISDTVIKGTSVTWTYLHKSAPDTVGDIVFNDGTAMTYISGLTLTEEQKAAAVVVIFYAGNESDILGEKLLGVGLHESEETLVWAKSGTLGYSTQITSIAIRGSGATNFETVDSAASWTFTSSSDLDGSNNWEEICKIDSTASENAAENYPAFDWVNKYASSYSIPVDTEKNWYMPTMAEHSMLYREKTTVNAAISLAGGNALTGQYWSSSQYNETSAGNGPTSAWNMNIDDGRGYWNNGGSGKAGSLKTIAICQF